MTQERWNRITEWPLILASLAFLGAYAWEILDDLSGGTERFAETVLWVTWAFFVVDYVANLVLCERGTRWRWFWRHILDFLVVVLPMFRALRVLRLLALLSVLNRTAGRAIRGRLIIYVTTAAVLLVLIAALAVLDAERGAPDAGITTFGDAIWWAFVTMTTVGYGDLAPVTMVGRAVAVALMIGGVALLGVITGTLASWIVDRVGEAGEQQQTATVAHIRSLEDKIDDLQGTLRDMKVQDLSAQGASRST